jgi:hypothetical protein
LGEPQIIRDIQFATFIVLVRQSGQAVSRPIIRRSMMFALAKAGLIEPTDNDRAVILEALAEIAKKLAATIASKRCCFGGGAASECSRTVKWIELFSRPADHRLGQNIHYGYVRPMQHQCSPAIQTSRNYTCQKKLP